MSNLTKRHLVVRISKETGLAQRIVSEIIDLTLCYIIDTLARGRTVEFRNFGIFEVKTRQARVGRNPRRPECEVPIPSRTVVKFKAGKHTKAKVRVLVLENGNAERPGR